MSKLKIKLIVGSTRANRFADKPVQWIHGLATARADLDVEKLDLRDYPLPFFEEPLPPGFAKDNYSNPQILRWREKVREARMRVSVQLAADFPVNAKARTFFVYPIRRCTKASTRRTPSSGLRPPSPASGRRGRLR